MSNPNPTVNTLNIYPEDYNHIIFITLIEKMINELNFIVTIVNETFIIKRSVPCSF